MPACMDASMQPRGQAATHANTQTHTHTYMGTHIHTLDYTIYIHTDTYVYITHVNTYPHTDTCMCRHDLRVHTTEVVAPSPPPPVPSALQLRRNGRRQMGRGGNMIHTFAHVRLRKHIITTCRACVYGKVGLKACHVGAFHVPESPEWQIHPLHTLLQAMRLRLRGLALGLL